MILGGAKKRGEVSLTQTIAELIPNGYVGKHRANGPACTDRNCDHGLDWNFDCPNLVAPF